eukprot:344836_1
MSFKCLFVDSSKCFSSVLSKYVLGLCFFFFFCSNLHYVIMAERTLDDLNADPILGIADEAEVMEITQMFEKWLIMEENDDGSRKKHTKKHAAKLQFSSLKLNTKSTDPLALLKRRSKPHKSVISVHRNTPKPNDTLRFDDLLGLVNDIEKEHLLNLKKKVENVKRMKTKNDKQFQRIIFEHFQKSRGLVKKIKNIKNRKKHRRTKYAKHTKAKRYNDRMHRRFVAKSRKKRLRRQSLNAW